MNYAGTSIENLEKTKYKVFSQVGCKSAWVDPLKDKKDIKITNAFPKNLDESARKPRKEWVDQGDEIYNRLFEIMISWQ